MPPKLDILRSVTRALDEAEIEALLVGDVGQLSRVADKHFYFIHQLGRWMFLGHDLASYAERIWAEYMSERTAWAEKC